MRWVKLNEERNWIKINKLSHDTWILFLLFAHTACVELGVLDIFIAKCRKLHLLAYFRYSKKSNWIRCLKKYSVNYKVLQNTITADVISIFLLKLSFLFLFPFFSFSSKINQKFATFRYFHLLSRPLPQIECCNPLNLTMCQYIPGK